MRYSRVCAACMGPPLGIILAGMALMGTGPGLGTATPTDGTASYQFAWDSRDCRTVVQGGGGDFTTIQAAISDPQTVDGTCIVVYPGTYLENVNFRGKNIVLQSTDPEDLQVVAATIIDGNQAGSVVTLEQHENRAAVLSGFTIRNGLSPRRSTNSYDGGGGIFCGSDAQPTIQNCVVEDSTAPNYGYYSGCGGGILFGGYSSYSAYSVYSTFINPLLANCSVQRNLAYRGGGGIAIANPRYVAKVTVDVTNCVIEGNATDSEGGGVFAAYDSYSPCEIMVNIHQSNIIGNQAGFGGGVGTRSSYSATPADPVISVSDSSVINNQAGGAGGIFLMAGEIIRTTVELNTATDNGSTGGGIVLQNGTVRDSTVSNNYAQGSSTGGGITLAGGVVDNCVIESNQAAQGGGCYGIAYSTPLSSSEVRNNTIIDNVADNGGGLAGHFDLIIGNTIKDNRASDQGGAVYNSAADIRNNLIELNLAWEGAGLYGCDGDIRDNIVRDNSAGLAGGGLRACDGDILQNTIVNNSAGFGGGLAGCWGLINGNIIWGNSALVVGPQIYFSEDPHYCDIQNHDGSGTNNISLDPLLTVDERLTAQSPCIGAGDPAFLPLPGETDTDGEQRVVDGRVDIGADEFSLPCIAGDFTGDSAITTDDLPAFIAALLDPPPTQGCLHGDMNGDGQVNGEDVQPFVDSLL